ncbi:MAG: hypothetical protein Q8K23_15890 [Sulfuritalea sp.]|jgi:hypothetical protein|nr:hypothetical protein [Sulfuritalea sp.]
MAEGVETLYSSGQIPSHVPCGADFQHYGIAGGNANAMLLYFRRDAIGE